MTDKKDTTPNFELIYPTWKSLLSDLFREIRKKEDHVQISSMKIQKLIDKVNILKNFEIGFDPNIVADFVQDGEATYEPGISLSEIREGIQKLSLGSNEFYTIYDIDAQNYVYVSDKVYDALGIKKENFTTFEVYSDKSSEGLLHPSDVFHVMKWGYLSYLVLATPGFKFRSNNDHYFISHRLRTNIVNDNESRYAVVEKRCYLCNDAATNNNFHPRMHLDRWTVLAEDPNHVVKAKFISTIDQDSSLNTLMYLLNALLMGVSPKFLILLNERILADRNKAVAAAVTEKINTYMGIDVDLDEQQVADCFSKTIRNKLSKLHNKWEPSSKKQYKIVSDAEAVRVATRLGLLPFTKDVERIIYSGISLGAKKQKRIRF